MPRQPLLDTPTLSKTGKAIGRPRKDPPPDAAVRIHAAAADGFSVRGVAMSLGTNEDALRRWFDEYPELKQAYDFGREQERQVLHNRLYRVATEGTGKDAIIAAMFLLKARHGYREGEQGETANKVSINFTLPGALSLTDFEKVISNEQPDDRDQRVSAQGLTVTRRS